MSNRKFYTLACYDIATAQPVALVYPEYLLDTGVAADYNSAGPADTDQINAILAAVGADNLIREITYNNGALIFGRRAEARQACRLLRNEDSEFTYRVIELGDKLARRYEPATYIIESRLVGICNKTQKVTSVVSGWNPYAQHNRRLDARQHVAELRKAQRDKGWAHSRMDYRIINRPIVSGVL